MDRTTKYAYWRDEQSLRRIGNYLKSTTPGRMATEYVSALTGKNIQRAAAAEKVTAERLQRITGLKNKELFKIYRKTPSGNYISPYAKRAQKLQEASEAAARELAEAKDLRIKAVSSSNKDMREIARIDRAIEDAKRRISKADTGYRRVLEKSKAVNLDRVDDLDSMRGRVVEYARTAPTAASEKMRTEDARILTGAAGVAGLAYGGNELYKAHRHKRSGRKELDYMPIFPKEASQKSIVKFILKGAGVVNEPTPEEHPSAPDKKLRPRAEVVIYNNEGVLAIKKDGYMLYPGGGIADGEKPDETAIREVMEEADRICHNLEKREVVSCVYDPAVMQFGEWDGEQTHFFIAMDGGESKMNHEDREDFAFIPFGEAREYLYQLISSEKQVWAIANNTTRLKLVMEAEGKAGKTQPIKYAKESNNE